MGGGVICKLLFWQVIVLQGMLVWHTVPDCPGRPWLPGPPWAKSTTTLFTALGKHRKLWSNISHVFLSAFSSVKLNLHWIESARWGENFIIFAGRGLGRGQNYVLSHRFFFYKLSWGSVYSSSPGFNHWESLARNLKFTVNQKHLEDF